jgi:hypothetical protein
MRKIDFLRNGEMSIRLIEMKCPDGYQDLKYFTEPETMVLNGFILSRLSSLLFTSPYPSFLSLL